MSGVKKNFDDIYGLEEKALEKVEKLESECFVRPLFRLFSVSVGVHDGLRLQCHYYGKYENDNIRGFILEYYEGVSLYEHMRQRGKFSERNVRELMRYVFSP